MKGFPLLLFVVAAAGSPRPAAAGGLGCVKKVGLPSYSPAARRSGGGSVTARVRVGAGGAAASVLASGANEVLRREVEASLKSDASYLESCEGQEVEFVFTFRLEGKAADYWPVRTLFRPPNHFILIARPMESKGDARR
jgi:hypothetical protein